MSGRDVSAAKALELAGVAALDQNAVIFLTGVGTARLACLNKQMNPKQAKELGQRLRARRCRPLCW